MSELPPAIPEGLAAAAESLEERLGEQLGYWDQRFHSIEGLLREWAQLAGSCSTFGDYVEDYLHQLGTRDILLDVMLAAEGSLQLWLVRIVDRIDDVFIQASDLDREDLMWGSSVDKPCNWWHRRIPRNEELRRQIETVAPEMRTHRPTVPTP